MQATLVTVDCAVNVVTEERKRNGIKYKPQKLLNYFCWGFGYTLSICISE